MRKRDVFTAILLCATVACSANAAGVEAWEAASTTATSITGDLRFSETKITFGNKASLPIAKVSDLDGFGAEGGTVHAVLYKTTGPSALTLLHGNGLCGDGKHPVAATYLVVWHPKPLGADEAPRSLAVFSGPAAPTSDRSPNLCGIYNYDSAKP